MKNFKADVICNSYLDGVLKGTTTEHRTVYERADGSLEVNFMGGKRAVRREGEKIIWDFHMKTAQTFTMREILTRRTGCADE